MTKDKALMIQDLINDGIIQRHAPTSVVATIEHYTEDDFQVIVEPDINNCGHSFHHIEVIADISRGFKVHSYIVITADDKIKVILF